VREAVFDGVQTAPGTDVERGYRDGDLAAQRQGDLELVALVAIGQAIFIQPIERREQCLAHERATISDRRSRAPRLVFFPRAQTMKFLTRGVSVQGGELVERNCCKAFHVIVAHAEQERHPANVVQITRHGKRDVVDERSIIATSGQRQQTCRHFSPRRPQDIRRDLFVTATSDRSFNRVCTRCPSAQHRTSNHTRKQPSSIHDSRNNVRPGHRPRLRDRESRLFSATISPRQISRAKPLGAAISIDLAPSLLPHSATK